MCGGLFGGGDGGAGRAAAQARADEAARQKRVDAGAERIKAAFAKFNPAFYQKIADDYETYATPKANDEFGGLGRALKIAVNDRGLRGSTIAAQEEASLRRQRDDAQREIRETGLDYSQRHRSNISSSFSDLLSQNVAIGDEDIASDIALRRADSLAQIPKFEPILTAFARGSELIDRQSKLEQASSRWPYVKHNRYSIFGLDKQPENVWG